MKIKVLIIEDNPLTSQDLREIIQSNQMRVTGVAADRAGVFASIAVDQPDVLLVDVNLKNGDNGIQLVEELARFHHFAVVYLTANADRPTIAQAMKTLPSAYLTKPFGENELLIALELAFRNHSKSTFSTLKAQNSFVFLKAGNRFEKVSLRTIQFLQAEGSYTKFVTDLKEYILSVNLQSATGKIGNASFLRIHRSYAVNIESITSIDNDYVFIGTKNLPIGRSYKESVQKVIQKIS